MCGNCLHTQVYGRVYSRIHICSLATHRPRRHTHSKLGPSTRSSPPAHLHALVPSEQRMALAFQDSCIHVGQGPDDYVLYHPQAPQMSRFKPFSSELVAVSSLTMSPVKSCQGPITGEELQG